MASAYLHLLSLDDAAIGSALAVESAASSRRLSGGSSGGSSGGGGTERGNGEETENGRNEGDALIAMAFRLKDIGSMSTKTLVNLRRMVVKKDVSLQ